MKIICCLGALISEAHHIISLSSSAGFYHPKCCLQRSSVPQTPDPCSMERLEEGLAASWAAAKHTTGKFY